MVYISEIQRENSLKKKILQRVKCFFNIIDVKNKEGKNILYLPIYDNKKTGNYKIIYLSKKIVKIIKDEDYIVLSKSLQRISILKNSLYSENINILNGRYLFKCLNFNILSYILKIKNENIESEGISILINDFNEINKDIIIELAKKVKTLSIVTNNINKFRKIEKYLYSEYGIVLNILNNKKNSLIGAKIIINIDFPEELVNQYRIYSKAVIINILNKIEIQSKKFNGVNINYFTIKMPEKYKIAGFKDEEIYESIIYKYNYKQVQEKCKEDNIEIINLIGNKGIILEQEFL